MSSSPRDAGSVVVIGGGLAGIAAALALADAGRRVILLERRPFLGGRVFSFRDPDTDAVVDNGQHVLVGACARLRAFLDRIGAPPGAFRRQRRFDLPIVDGRGRIAHLRAAPLPAPLHLLAALLRYRHLPLAARGAVAAAARALVALSASERAALDGVSLGAWLARRETPAVAIERFWEPIVRPALNVRVDEANLPLAAFLFERGVWRGAGSGALWLPAVGLSEAIGEPAGRALAAVGVAVRAGARARSIALAGSRVEGVVLADGESVPASAVVAAVPPAALDRLLPAPAGSTVPHAALGESPIVNVYLWYDRPVAPVPFAGVFDAPLQWVFDRAALLGREAAGGWCLGISLSAADEWLPRARPEVAETCDEAVARVFPRRRSARLVRSAIVKEPRATFRAGPGLAGLRPGPVGPFAGLVLAGDWTDTGWPATMEGAVRSGEAAAAALLAGAAERGATAT